MAYEIWYNHKGDNMKKRLKPQGIIILLGVILSLTVMGAFAIKTLKSKAKKPTVQEKPDDQEEPKDEVTDDITEVSFVNVGDLLYHDSFLLDQSVDSFKENYKFVKDWFKGTDLVMGNYETTTNPNRNYSGYPSFNTPISALTAIKDAGFDVLNTNNNHTLDTGLEGVKTTLESARQEGLKTVGTQFEDEPRRLDIEVKGIKFGILSYSYGYNGLDANLSSYEKETFINKIDEEKMEKEIKESHEVNDFTLINIHWGEEYAISPNSTQKNLAQKMSDWGADVILGSHPHVIQTFEKISDTYVIYSHGNFVSNQRLETMDDIETERGLITEIVFQKNMSDNTKTIQSVDTYPTWVNKYGDGPYYFNVIPTHLYLDGKIDIELSEDAKDRIQKAHDSVNARMSQ